MNKGFVAVLASAAAIAFGGPYFTGKEAESQYRGLIDTINSQTGIKGSIESYEKGYFKSVAMTKLTLEPALGGAADDYNDLPKEFTVKTEFSHGIYAVTSVSHLVLPEGASEELKPYIKDAPPIEVVAKYSLLSGVDVSAYTPSVDFESKEEGRSLKIAPLNVSLTMPASADSMALDMQWSGMSFAQDKTAYQDITQSFEMGPLQVIQAGEKISPFLWSSDFEMTLAQIAANEGDKKLVLDKIEFLSNTQEGQVGRVDSVSEIRVAEVKLNNDAFKNQRIKFAIRDLAITHFDELMIALEGLEKASYVDDPQQQAMAQMEAFTAVSEKFSALLMQGLKIEMPELVVNTADGAITGSMNIEQPSVQPNPNAPQMMLLQTTKGDLLLELPAKLFDGATPEVIQQLEQLKAQNFLVLSGNVYKAEVHLSDMILNVNGAQIPLPPLF